LAAGEDVVRRDTVALWPDPRQRKRWKLLCRLHPAD